MNLDQLSIRDQISHFRRHVENIFRCIDPLAHLVDRLTIAEQAGLLTETEKDELQSAVELLKVFVDALQKKHL